jgi:hypothetical protein
VEGVHYISREMSKYTVVYRLWWMTRRRTGMGGRCLEILCLLRWFKQGRIDEEGKKTGEWLGCAVLSVRARDRRG